MRRILLALSLLALAAPAGAAGAAGDEPSTVADCANPALPSEILKHAPAKTVAPLEVIDATGAAKPLRLAVADDTPTRELGLMCVTGLRPQHGMLFVFTQASLQPFWMKNTLIALDMVWLDGDGTVTAVAADVPASTRSTPNAAVARRSGTGRFVIELASGEARADGIVTGLRLALPALHASP
ncbi:MAG: DUF192 domain-containing protein [Candidatus Eremiobacteraeota bacterium]|nr:DUF192 domain-containing protein [Candidatus Eremiobacteraeota bacterium]